MILYSRRDCLSRRTPLDVMHGCPCMAAHFRLPRGTQSPQSRGGTFTPHRGRFHQWPTVRLACTFTLCCTSAAAPLFCAITAMPAAPTAVPVIWLDMSKLPESAAAVPPAPPMPPAPMPEPPEPPAPPEPPVLELSPLLPPVPEPEPLLASALPLPPEPAAHEPAPPAAELESLPPLPPLPKKGWLPPFDAELLLLPSPA